MRAHIHLGKITIVLAAAAIAVAPTALAYTGAEDSLDVAPTIQHLAAAVDPRSPDTRDAAAQQQTAATADRRSPDTRDESPATRSASANAVMTAPVDGRSPDTIDAATPAQASVVTVTRSPGFQWGDFGIGAAAAVTAMLMLSLTTYLLAARHNRKQPSPVATA